MHGWMDGYPSCDVPTPPSIYTQSIEPQYLQQKFPFCLLMARRRVFPLLLAVLLLVAASFSSQSLSALPPSQTLESSFHKAVADLKEVVVRGLGPQAEGVEVSGFDPGEAVVGSSVGYEFHVEVGGKVLPIKLLEDVSRWEFVDVTASSAEGEEKKDLVEFGRRAGSGKVYPALDSFQLAGPMELWIQDGDDMRLALPHDVDAGVLKKVILSDGAVVTIKGARSVSLRHPVELPLPLNRTNRKGEPVAAGLLAIAEALRSASVSNEKPLLSLRIVGPTSLTTSAKTINDKLKIKRLAPGYVELSSSMPAISAENDDTNPPTLWPLTSLNGSDVNLRGFEELLASVLGESGRKEGSFRLVKVEVAAQTCVKLSFATTRRLSESTDWSGFPEWRTRPKTITSHYEVLARLEDNGKVIPERIAEVEPLEIKDTILESELTGNVSMSRIPIIHPAPIYFTL